MKQYEWDPISAGVTDVQLQGASVKSSLADASSRVSLSVRVRITAARVASAEKMAQWLPTANTQRDWA